MYEIIFCDDINEENDKSHGEYTFALFIYIITENNLTYVNILSIEKLCNVQLESFKSRTEEYRSKVL